jgi:hypothetical protein
LEFQETDAVSNGVLFGRFAGATETFLLWFGLSWSAIFGAALPGFCFIFGELINDMGSMASSSEENVMVTNSIYMIYVACGVLVTSAFYIASLSIFSESITRNFKIEYFSSALSKDAAFYDE